jgi:N-acetyl-alpha-D-glucosaminyl L-malate synthase BshA
MAEAVREHGVELFHVHYALPHAIAGFVAQQMLGDNAPRMVTTLHGTDITIVGQDHSFFEITRFGIERSDAITAVSEFLSRMTTEEFQIERPIDVIPNFVDLEQYPLERPDRSAFAEMGQKVLLHVSNFRPVKRILDAVRIFEKVTRETDAVMLMVGEGPERSSAQALARRLGVADRIRFLGTRREIAQIAGMADVFLLPSELESFGLSALEAMACGVPVVGSDSGGLPEVVRHAESGYLLPVGDVEGMAARAIEILQDDEHRREMGAAARHRVESLFDAERVVSQYENVYDRVLGL